MLVDYEKDRNEFSFVEQVALTSKAGRAYKRMFWRFNADDRFATYIELSDSYNKDVLDEIRSIVDSRIVGFSFGKKPKTKHTPQYTVVLDTGKKINLSYAELESKLETVDDTARARELMLDAPFTLGENMRNQLGEIVGKPTNQAERELF